MPSHAEDRATFLQVGRNRHRTSDHVEQHIPLRAQQQHDNRRQPESASQANEHQQNHRQQRRRRHRSRDLRQRLRNARQSGIEADRDSRRNCPQRADQQGQIHAQKSCSQAQGGRMQFRLLPRR